MILSCSILYDLEPADCSASGSTDDQPKYTNSLISQFIEPSTLIHCCMDPMSCKPIIVFIETDIFPHPTRHQA